jgi:hypothetical protein
VLELIIRLATLDAPIDTIVNIAAASGSFREINMKLFFFSEALTHAALAARILHHAIEDGDLDFSACPIFGQQHE